MAHIPYVFEISMPREQGERPNHVHYICPCCNEQLEHCTCPIPPSFLYGCEESMQDIAKVLNKKGYVTRCCLDAHGYRQGFIYFSEEYGLTHRLPLPDGCTYSHADHVLTFKRARSVSGEKAKLLDKKRLEDMMAWAESLPVAEKQPDRTHLLHVPDPSVPLCRKVSSDINEAFLSYQCWGCGKPVDHCTCQNGPNWRLGHMDYALLKHMRILNSKNYDAMFCCEGHDSFAEFFIEFTSSEIYYEYNHENPQENMPPLPQGFKAECYDDGVGVTITITDSSDGLTPEEFKARKAELIEQLLEWCKSLPKTEGWLPED